MFCLPIIVEHIGLHGPITVAEFMQLALYHPEAGYYASARRRSGREGDFFTSVDVGPEFGSLLSSQFAEMWRRLEPRPASFDLVEAGAGDGRLARDVLEWAEAEDGEFYRALRLHLVEASAEARAAQSDTLGPHLARLVSAGDTIPAGVTGVIYANELLDAMPVHLVEMTPDGLMEVYVAAGRGGLVERLGPLSSPALADHFSALGVRLRQGWRGEVGLRAIAWMEAAARALDRGFLLIIDYGHPAAELYSAARRGGTLRAISRHVVVPEAGVAGRPPWLEAPGARDLTTHVDLTSIQRSAERAGLVTLGLRDQGHFLLSLGLAERLASPTGNPARDCRQRLALKSLVIPGGPGSAHKVAVFGKAVGRPALAGLSGGGRLT